MQYSYLLLSLFVISAGSLLAQCPSGNVNLSTQAEVDAYIATYPNCTEVNGSLLIGPPFGSSDITDLTGLEGLSTVSGTLRIQLNDSLVSLIGLDNLTSIGGFLLIDRNDALATLTGLESLTTVDGNLDIGGNRSLESLMGLENLASVGGYLSITGNNTLPSLTGLSGLSSVGGFLAINVNDNLLSLTGLSALTTVGGYVAIWSNGSLASLTGLESLTTIGGYLGLVGNSNLTNLASLENLDASAITDLSIQNSPQLSNCAVTSICDYLGIAMSIATISGNATGCASREEVEMACVVSTVDMLPTDIELFPNPTSGRLQWRNVVAERVEVFTAQGQRVMDDTNPGQELDLSGLTAGVYVLHLVAADGVHASRVVKK
ncbi:MAG: T9SS type A sorting domain-containing protein [Bacteroidota bacterium]